MISLYLYLSSSIFIFLYLWAAFSDEQGFRSLSGTNKISILGILSIFSLIWPLLLVGMIYSTITEVKKKRKIEEKQESNDG